MSHDVDSMRSILGIACDGYWAPSDEKPWITNKRFGDIINLVIAEDALAADIEASGVASFDWVGPWFGGYCAGLATALIAALVVALL